MRNDEERKVGIRNVVTLGIVSFLNDMSTEMIRPMLPTFVINVLGGISVNIILRIFINSLLDAISNPWLRNFSINSAAFFIASSMLPLNFKI